MPQLIIPLKLLRIQGEGIHLLISGRINKKPARFIVDTGASQSVLDLNRIHLFHKGGKPRLHDMISTGLGVSDMKSFVIDEVSLQLGKRLFEKMAFICLDLANINQSYEHIRLKPIDGVLGGDFLWQYKAVIDYSKRQLKISVPSLK
jgi:hypothetical protein